MRGIRRDIEEKGVRLLVIGNGSAAQARLFAEDQDLVGAVYTDPSGSVYRALGMKRGVFSTFNRRTLRHAARAYLAGFRQSRTQGQPFQQGGVLLVGRQGEVVWAYLSEEAGDHPSNAEILAALGGLTRPDSEQPRVRG